jgi:ABC-type Zn uptake system ZnuABC Zn-binding protein ZnuA
LPRVVATATFLADIAQNVAGDRLQVSSMVPHGVDPHDFQPTPSDVAKAADSDVLIVNGAGFEGFLETMLENVGGERVLVEASAGLASRQPDEGLEHEDDEHADEEEDHGELDPHFWLDPHNAIRYAENIRDGLSAADPDGAGLYAANAEAYIERLQELDRWITEQVQQVPADDRLLVTNHDSFGYYADRYGFRVVGTIIPSVGTGAEPSARQLTHLIEEIRESGAKAVFLETGTNPRLANQIGEEAGVKVVTQLHSHSTTKDGGTAPTYVDMMQYNTAQIVEALR